MASQSIALTYVLIYLYIDAYYTMVLLMAAQRKVWQYQEAFSEA